MAVPHFLSPLLRESLSPRALYVTDRAEPLARRLETAFDSASRRRGLLGRTHLPPDQALIIAPGNLIHTFRMAFPIDVIFAARDGRIVKLRRRLPPGRISGAFRAFATIEMAEGTIDRADLVVGQMVVVRAIDDEASR